jgi:hypothetical protein
VGVSVLLVLAAAASVAALDEYERRLASGRRTWPLE